MGRRRKHPKRKQKTPKWYQRENKWGDFVFDWTLGLGTDTWREIISILVLVFAVVTFLGYLDLAGVFGTKLALSMRKTFGFTPSYIFPFVLFWLGILLLFPQKKQLRFSRFIGFIFLVVTISTLFHLFISITDARDAAMMGAGGGVLGFIVSDPLRKGLGLFIAFLVVMTVMIISLMMIFDVTIKKMLKLKDEDKDDDEMQVKDSTKKSLLANIKENLGKLRRIKSPKDDDAKAPVIEVEPRSLSQDKDWQFPPIDILKSSNDVANPGNIQKNVEIIRKTLRNFGIEIDPDNVNIGPTVTQYSFKPAEGVKLNQITARINDLALALASKNLRIEAPIPGKSSVGIEHPNKIPAKVTLREIITEKEFKEVKSKLALALGRDVSGTPVAIDLEKMPHLLIAGATGSGKSICINSIINTLLYHNSPSDLRLLFIDPKRVELTNYNDIPHLLAPVIIDVDKTVSALKWAVSEMEKRYKMFSEIGKRNIVAYNSSVKPEDKLPYIVIIVDELADLMAAAANDVEGSIVRIAQMARATGMHLIIATQRPSVDVITGLIKANITARIAFATASQVDSRTILDISGADKLLGNGDMLFLGNGLSKPKRVQGCFVSDGEISQLVKFLKDAAPADYDQSILEFKSVKSGGLVGSLENAGDDMYEDAVRVVTESGKASATLLQRRLRIGYARAARLLDLLEENGVVGPADGAKPRDVMLTPDNTGAISSSSPNNSSSPKDEIDYGGGL